MSPPQPGKRTIVLAILAILLTVTVLVIRRPYYNWDMFPYMAIAIGHESVPFDSTHREVYRIARATLPPADFDAISTRQPDLMSDAAAFEGILKYYTIKPGYNLVVAGLCSLGINPVTATALPSAVSYFLLGCLLLFWTLHTGPAGPAGLFTLVIALAPSLIDLARYSSPDMLCALISTAGIMLILAARPITGMTFLLAAVWIRPDAALLLAIATFALTMSSNLRWPAAAVFLLAAIGSILFLFKGSSLFSEYLLLESSANDRMSAYLEGMGSVFRSYTIPAIVLSAVLLQFRKALRKNDPGYWLVLAASATLFARYLLHPFVEDRFHLPAYSLILLISWDTLVGRLYPHQQTNR